MTITQPLGGRMIKACTRWALALALASLVPAIVSAEEVLEVDLGAPEGSPTPAPAKPAPSVAPAEAPTAAPSPAPAAPNAVASPAPNAVPSPVAVTTQGTTVDMEPTAAATPAPDAALDKVRFDKGGADDEGLMIIAPGAASPEDSLESFGIDSPFNWKGRDRKVLKPGEAPEGDESLELSAPEASDLKERVSVENGEGEAVPGEGDYDRVERAGIVLGASEYRVDGRVARTAGGSFFATVGRQVALRIEPGRQVYPGSVYTVFREAGIQRGNGPDAQDVGMLVRNTGVLKVIRVEGEEVLARVERQYEPILEGDLIRLRDPERLSFYASLRQGGSAPLDLHGEVLGVMPPALMAQKGDIVFLDLGRSQGAFPGLRLLLSRDADEPDREGVRPVRETGRLGQVEILNVSRNAATARVVRARAEVRPGDKVRYR
jgi:hypothetical protein